MTRVRSTVRLATLLLAVIPALCFAPTRASTVAHKSLTKPQSLADAAWLKLDRRRRPVSQTKTGETASLTTSTRLNAVKFPSYNKETRNTLFSAVSFIVMDVFFRRLFRALQIDFPSSLGGCGVLFALLLSLPKEYATAIYKRISPGAALLAKWLPIFFVPSLVTLPLAQSMGSADQLAKIGAVIVVGFFFTLLTTSGSVVGIRKLLGGGSSPNTVAAGATAAVEEKVEQVAPKKAFSDETFNILGLFTSVFGLAALASTGRTGLSGPLSALFLLGATLQSFVFGARLPKKFTKIVHPLVVCTSLSWLVMTGFGAIVGQSFRSMLQSYRTGSLAPMRTGPGDLLLFMLGPAVVSLAVSMYDRRQLMRDNLPEVATAVSVSTLGGVFGTALAVRLLALANPAIRLGLLSRNITSPLAMAIASILGADISLAVSFVVVTGLIGANFGASVLDAVGIKDPVARGLGMGAAAHGLGTAAIANEKDAFPFAAIAMALTASAATVTVSIPVLKRMVVKLALGY